MDELKTLKQITEKVEQDILPQDNPILDIDEYVIVEDLKQEVIKWIKFIGEDYVPIPKVITLKDLQDSGELMKFHLKAESGLVVNWIKHFFNIEETEEK